MCGLVNERSLQRMSRVPTSSPGPGPSSSKPKAWGSDLAPQIAMGVGAPRPWLPGFEGVFPQVFYRAPFSLQTRALQRNPRGPLFLGAL